MSMNIARLKKGQENFEVVVNPDLAMQFKKNQSIAISEVLSYPKIFSDAKKGMQASEQRLKALFGTSDAEEVAKLIIIQGTVQLTAEYRSNMLEEKRKRIVHVISLNAIDPRTNAPHPVSRIENAMQEAKCRIDEFKQADEQVNDVIKAMRTILPIKLVIKEIEIVLPAQSAGKAYSVIKRFATIKNEEWQMMDHGKGM